LKERGIPFHIYEAAHKFSEIGAGVGLTPNAQRAMKLISPAILEGYKKHETNNYYEEKRDTYFQYRMGLDYKGKKEGEMICESGRKGCGMV
jgi:salicylate hydroxylase